MTTIEVFNCMQNGNKIRITKKFRSYWGIENLGQWFYILAVNADETAKICNENHMIFNGAPVTELIR